MSLPNDWSAADICLDKDLSAIESRAISWGKNQGDLSTARDAAKDDMESRLRSTLHEKALLLLESDSSTDVLDLIEDYAPLRKAASYLSLYYLCNDLMVDPSDLFTAKAAHYLDRFGEEFPKAVKRLSFDSDESGSIESGENYNITTGVKFTR
jgi:hypothetical protein